MISYAHFWILWGIPLLTLLFATRDRWHRPAMLYFFPAAQLAPRYAPRTFFPWLEWAVLLLLIGALARPRRELERHGEQIPGIDIMLVLDVSGSMNYYDDLKDRRSRWQIAQKEAIAFIEKRIPDAIGVVFCGAIAVSRAPLTHDKKLLKDMIVNTQLGDINPDGTLLAGALMLAGKKLSAAQSASKVMIVLTDGAPSPHDIDPQLALDFLKKEHIKVYTIGIGSGEGGYVDHPFFGTMRVETPLNSALLKRIAQETGGQFFEAHKPRELAEIYHKIDALEKIDHTVPHQVVYREYFIYLLWCAAFLSLINLLGRWWYRWL